MGLLGASLSIVVSASVARNIFDRIGPATVTAFRLTVAGVVMALVMRPAWRSWSHAQRLRVMAGGGLLGATVLLLYESFARIPLGAASALQFLGPLGLAVATSRRLVHLVFAALALTGVALMARGLAEAHGLGLAFALLSALGWALYIRWAGRIGPELGTAVLGVAILVAGVCTIPVALLEQQHELRLPADVPVMFVVVVGGSLIPQLLDFRAMVALPARLYGVLVSVEPALAALAGLVLLGQHLRPAEWIGIGLVCVAAAGAMAAHGAVPKAPPGA